MTNLLNLSLKNWILSTNIKQTAEEDNNQSVLTANVSKRMKNQHSSYKNSNKNPFVTAALDQIEITYLLTGKHHIYCLLKQSRS